MSARYAVIGNPVAHSRSPSIHALFARQTAQDIEYGRLLAPLDGFVAAVERFRDEGGQGLNVTVPFKREAFAWAGRHSERAKQAGAVNTLRFETEPASGRPVAFGDNTDGAGLVRDIEQRLGLPLAGRSVLLLGAGGAARGVVGPLLDAGVAELAIANRTPERARELADAFARGPVRPVPAGFAALRAGFEVIVNATSSGLHGEFLAIDDAVLGGALLAYDMFYGPQPGNFLRRAHSAGCPRISDGLGMLVEQAAESFLVWRGVRPATGAVYDALRAELSAETSLP